MKVSIAPSGRHFVTEDGSPFFWLADTAWNAALHADTDDWRRYLDARRRQGFTVIQFVSTPWRGCRAPAHGPLFEETDSGVQFPEQAWGKMEEWLQMIVDHDMVPAPVMIWDNNPDEPFFKFKTDTCIAVGRRMLERWQRFSPLWILAGDGDYRSRAQDEKWKTVGRAVFGDFPDALATMHPCGSCWVGDNFADEPWYSFVGIQSGHGSSRYDLNFLLNGPYSRRWTHIEKPFVNLELNYEFSRSYHNHEMRYSGYHVRRAFWWSLLGAPTAGATYGTDPIWIWPTTRYEAAEGHGGFWAAGHWSTGLETEGIANLGAMLDIVGKLPWTELLPADCLLREQPGWDDPVQCFKTAATPDHATVVTYLPTGGRVKLSGVQLQGEYAGTWFDPRSGLEQQAEIETSTGLLEAQAPSDDDWVLVLRR